MTKEDGDICGIVSKDTIQVYGQTLFCSTNTKFIQILNHVNALGRLDTSILINSEYADRVLAYMCCLKPYLKHFGYTALLLILSWFGMIYLMKFAMPQFSPVSEKASPWYTGLGKSFGMMIFKLYFGVAHWSLSGGN